MGCQLFCASTPIMAQMQPACSPAVEHTKFSYHLINSSVFIELIFEWKWIVKVNFSLKSSRNRQYALEMSSQSELNPLHGKAGIISKNR